MLALPEPSIARKRIPSEHKEFFSDDKEEKFAKGYCIGHEGYTHLIMENMPRIFVVQKYPVAVGERVGRRSVLTRVNSSVCIECYDSYLRTFRYFT